jgi:hypothetical protein
MARRSKLLSVANNMTDSHAKLSLFVLRSQALYLANKNANIRRPSKIKLRLLRLGRSWQPSKLSDDSRNTVLCSIVRGTASPNGIGIARRRSLFRDILYYLVSLTISSAEIDRRINSVVLRDDSFLARAPQVRCPPISPRMSPEQGSLRAKGLEVASANMQRIAKSVSTSGSVLVE